MFVYVCHIFLPSCVYLHHICHVVLALLKSAAARVRRPALDVPPVGCMNATNVCICQCAKSSLMYISVILSMNTNVKLYTVIN